MKTIETVLGPIPPETLGFCQSHEHIWIEKGYSAQVNPALCIDDANRSLQELEQYHMLEGAAIVDAQPVGCGRNAQRLRTLSQESGVHIIASTGFHKLMFYPEAHWIFTWDETRLAALFTQELTHGMFATCDDTEPKQCVPSRAGQIKTALDVEGLTPRYQTLFRAAAQAALATGAPLMAHIEGGADPLELADFLVAQGVAPQRMIFCHLDRAVADFDVHRALCAQGITLEYDTVARPKYHDDRQEVALVRQLLEAGFSSQLLMSLDVTRARLLSYGGSVGLGYLLRTFLPLLGGSGVTEAQMTEIFVQNPARIFAAPEWSIQ